MTLKNTLAQREQRAEKLLTEPQISYTWRLGGEKSESGKEDIPAKHVLSSVEGAQRREAENCTNPAASFGVVELSDDNCFRVSPPNVSIGGLVRVPPVVSTVEPPLNACGNDGFRYCNKLHPRQLKK